MSSICDICIAHGLPLRHLGRGVGDARRNGHDYYCAIDLGLGELEGLYRVSNEDDVYNPNYACACTPEVERALKQEPWYFMEV